jgi:hypothetical protein
LQPFLDALQTPQQQTNAHHYVRRCAPFVSVRQGDGSYKHDYLLSNAPLTAEVCECAGVFKAQHRIEECLRRAKGEAGLGDYQVRTWSGWHHHQTLALLATWLLTQETRRGKKADPGVDGAAGGGVAGGLADATVGLSSSVANASADEPSFASQRGSSSLRRLAAEDFPKSSFPLPALVR